MKSFFVSTQKQKLTTRGSNISILAWAKTPIDTLPTEILSYVFELVTRMKELHTLPLIRVSRAWRDLVLNSAKFWSHINLSPTRPDLHLSLVRGWTCGKMYPGSAVYLHSQYSSNHPEHFRSMIPDIWPSFVMVLCGSKLL